MDYFTKCANLAEAKKLYRDLLMEHHPDHGGDEETCKEIVRQFELFCKSYMGGRFHESGRSYSAEDVWSFSGVLSKACELNCRIEVVGTWIWAWTTKDETDIHSALSALGFRFSRKQKGWYYNGMVKIRKASSLPMEQIRKVYGSKLIRDHEEKIRIA